MCSSFCGPLRDRFHAWLLHETDTAMHSVYGRRKTKLFERHPPEIVEIGPGIGANFRYYRPGTKVRAIEPNPGMHARLCQRARRFGVDLELIPTTAETLEIADGSVPMVVGTLVLCSVVDPLGVVRKIRQMLQPGGRYIFMEHVAAAPGSLSAFQQWLLRVPWKWLFNGCRVDQSTLELIESGGFEMVASDHFTIGRGLLPFSPHIIGSAIK